MITITDIETEFKKYIVLKDKYIIRVIMATIVGNFLLDRDPIWTMISAPSSGGKTTVVAPCLLIPNIHYIDDLTEKAFLSGYKTKDKKDVSLLHVIGSGIMVFSDFTSILAKNPIAQGEILTQMRLIYDGKLSKQTGTGSIKWSGKIGFLGASTSSIYKYMEKSRSMGERFIYYWLDQPTNQEVAHKQAEVQMSSVSITNSMSGFYSQYFQAIKDFTVLHGIPELKLTPAQRERIENAAIFATHGKTAIDRDFKTGKPDSMPEIAGIGRDIKSMDALLHAMQLMNCAEAGNIDVAVTDDMIDVIEKCAYSSVNRERRKVLEILAKSPNSLSTSEIGTRDGFGLSSDAVIKYLDPLHAVGLVQKVVSSTNRWYIKSENIKQFIIKVSSILNDPMLIENPEEILTTSILMEDDEDTNLKDPDYLELLDKEFESYGK